ncbi:MAG TPA: hypothetical protein VIY56_17375 [Vicinamibacterales bacterium]
MDVRPQAFGAHGAARSFLADALPLPLCFRVLDEVGMLDEPCPVNRPRDGADAFGHGALGFDEGCDGGREGEHGGCVLTQGGDEICD